MTTEIHGFCDPRFQPLKDVFRANFEDGLELGASLAVTHMGRPVVDLWAGWVDRKRTRPWEKDTIVCVFSTTKIMAIIETLMVLDRGLIELDAPVAHYWPEFAQGGKGAVTVRDAFTHQAGVPGFQHPAPFDVLLDWEAVRPARRRAALVRWRAGHVLPRDDLRLPARRAHPPRRRAHARALLRRGGRGQGMRRLPHRPDIQRRPRAHCSASSS